MPSFVATVWECRHAHILLVALWQSSPFILPPVVVIFGILTHTYTHTYIQNSANMDDDDERYFEDYTVAGELERLVKAIADKFSKLGQEDDNIVLPFRLDSKLVIKRVTACKHKLLDSIPHFSFLDNVAGLFDCEKYYIVSIDQPDRHFMSINTAKMVQSAFWLAVSSNGTTEDIPCFVKFGDNNDFLIGKAKDSHLYSFIPGNINDLIFDKKHNMRCSAMITLSLHDKPSTRWSNSIVSHDEIVFPLKLVHVAVNEYKLRAIFPQISSDCIEKGADALLAPILLLSTPNMTDCDDLVIGQSALFLSRLAEYCASNDDHDVVVKRRRLRTISPIRLQDVSILCDYIFGGNPRDHIGQRLMKAFYSLLYDYGFTEQALSIVSAVLMEFASRLRQYYNDHDGTKVDIHEKPDWEEPLMFQKLSVLKYCLLVGREDAIESDNGHNDKDECDMKLYECPDQPFVIPKTQSHKQSDYFMTSDTFGHYQEALEKYASDQRCRLHAAPLMSDMQAFKAANPNCHIIDFMRWHSPKDVIVVENDDDDDIKETLELSDRMKDTNSVWQELWRQAEPVPIEQQEPLYTPWKEAEKALFYFEDLTVKDLVEQMLAYSPTVFNIQQEHRALLKSSLIRLLVSDYDDNNEGIGCKIDGGEVLVATEEDRDFLETVFKGNISKLTVLQECFVLDKVTLVRQKNMPTCIARVQACN